MHVLPIFMFGAFKYFPWFAMNNACSIDDRMFCADFCECARANASYANARIADMCRLILVSTVVYAKQKTTGHNIDL